MADSAIGDRPPLADTGSLDCARIAFRHHAWFLGYLLLYVSAVVVILSAIDRPYRILDGLYVFAAVVPTSLALVFVLLGMVAYHLLHVRPVSWRGFLQELRDDERLRLSRLVYALIPILTIVAFQSAFTSFKSSLPVIQPFSYDVAFMEFDRWLHFGRHPWEWLQPVFGYPIVTSVLSFAYKFWAGVFYLVFYWMAFSLRDPVLRMRYLLTYLLTWSLVGSLGAVLLSSAGPCFFGFVVGGEDPYAPLLAYLKSAGEVYPNWQLVIQDYLWENYSEGNLATASGITAMPSMHVAVAALQALLGWQISRRAGILLTAYCGVILIGSVHLGWHYAIDGYVSILAVIVIWKAVGWALRFHPSFAWNEATRPDPDAAQAAAAR